MVVGGASKLVNYWAQSISTRSVIQVTHLLRDALEKKLRYYLGFFPKSRTPHPAFGNPLFEEEKKLSFILHFRPLGTFLVFTKKLKFCHYFFIYFWG